MNFAASRYMMVPRPIWIVAIVLGFWFWWPVGLADPPLSPRHPTLRQWQPCPRCWGGQRAGWLGQWQFPATSMCRALRVASPSLLPRATAPSTTIAPRRCAAWKTSRRSSSNISIACVKRGTGRSSSSSWPSAASGPRSHGRRPSAAVTGMAGAPCSRLPPSPKQAPNSDGSVPCREPSCSHCCSLALAGCKPNYSANSYNSTAVQQANKVDQGGGDRPPAGGRHR